MNITEKMKALTGALEKAPFFCRLAAVLIAGIALSFIHAPYNLWPLLFLCLSVLYFYYSKAENKKQVFALGFVFGIGYFVTGLNWIGNALLVEGNQYWWVWPIAVIALPTLLSLFAALYLTLSHMFFKKDTLGGLLGFCALLTLSEWVRGYAFTGFPWNLYGYGWISVLSMAQSASLIGPYGLTLLSVFWGCIIGFLLHAGFKKSVVLACIVTLVGVFSYGQCRLTKSEQKFDEEITFHIVQPNIAQADKWKSEQLAGNFEKHVELSNIKQRTRRNIIVWPETALPPVFLDSAAVSQRIRSVLDANTILLTGALQITKGEKGPLYHNALLVWERQRQKPTRLYSKSHLVPLGEYIPFQEYIPLKPVVEFSGFEKGFGAQTIGLDEFPSLTTLICYEIIFPHEITDPNQLRPDYILTITNDAWYGDSPGPRQHFAQARLRAIEQGLPVIRSANTGISGLIDPYGRVLQKAALMEEATLTSPLPLRAPKTYYSMFGDRIFLAMLFFCLISGIVSKRR